MKSTFPPQQRMKLYFVSFPNCWSLFHYGGVTLNTCLSQGDDPLQKYSLVWENTVQTVFLKWLRRSQRQAFEEAFLYHWLPSPWVWTDGNVHQACPLPLPLWNRRPGRSFMVLEGLRWWLGLGGGQCGLGGIPIWLRPYFRWGSGPICLETFPERSAAGIRDFRDGCCHSVYRREISVIRPSRGFCWNRTMCLLQLYHALSSRGSFTVVLFRYLVQRKTRSDGPALIRSGKITTWTRSDWNVDRQTFFNR